MSDSYDKYLETQESINEQFDCFEKHAKRKMEQCDCPDCNYDAAYAFNERMQISMDAVDNESELFESKYYDNDQDFEI